MGAHSGAGLAVGPMSGPAATSSACATTVSPPTYVPGEVLVKFKRGSNAGARATAAREAGADAVLNRVGPTGNTNTLLFSLDPKTSVEEAVRRLRSSRNVVFAEPNFLGQILYTPSDPYFPQQWGLQNTGQKIGGVYGTPGADIDATRAWDLERGDTNPVNVAVLDSGIYQSHPDLDSKIWKNSDEVPGNKIDDDGNGYVDDVNGYNWAGISQRTYTYFSGGAWQTMYKELGTGVDAQGFAQSIIGTGCDLTDVGVMLSKENSPTGGVKVSLRRDLGGTDIGYFTISPSELTDSPKEIYKPLSSGLKLQRGATYYIVVETTNADPTNYYLLYDYQLAKTGWFSYWDGQEFSWDGTIWSADDGDDLYFRTNPNPCPSDDGGHGTQVSGIIAAEHNDLGIAGVSRGAKIMPLKIVDSSGVYTSADLCNALRYAADNGARVANMSLRGQSSSAVQDAINYACGKGVVPFAAAGNDGNSTIWYPAGYQNVIGVGATTNRDGKASFSNHNSSVDVSAPGRNIYTTDRFGGFTVTSGTSYAAPHAAGLASLILSAKPSYTPSQVERAIEKYADDLGAHGRDDYFGYGRINAYQTIKGVLLPRIDSVNPSFGPTGSDLTIKGVDFGNPKGGSHVSFGSSRAAIKSWAKDRIVCTVPGGLSGTVPVTVTNPVGTSNAKRFQITLPVWYLAEGSTAWGFETTINVENPNDSILSARLTYMLSNGTSKARVVTLPKMSQTVINPKDDLGEQDFSTRIECLESKTIAVDRTTRWSSGHANDTGEHNSIGVTGPAKTWYLPEGSSAWGFECWLLVQNPNSTEAKCQITYMIEGKPPLTVTKAIRPNSRATFNMADDIGPVDASIKIESDLPVIPERAMYTHWLSPETGTMVRREGHDSIGTTATASDYYLAEGTTAWGFTTYVLVQNPNKAPASITLTYMTETGAVDDKPFTMPPESRRTVRLNDFHPNLDLSTRVHADKPIIAERSMYWASPNVPDSGLGTHDSIGTDALHATWYLPSGGVWKADGGTETYTLVQNPNGSDVQVRITYLKPDGIGNVSFTDTVPARSRKTYNMADKLSETNAAIMVECLVEGKKIIAERSMYSNGRWGGSETIGGYAP